jgi:hypothetical protein
MTPSAKERERKRGAGARLRMLHHCEHVTRNISQTCRFFGTSRTILYRWRPPVPSDGSRPSGMR